ncbi:UNVERIFIED_ORG: hypothetical protein M2312_000567 [Rhizobium esperanzae]|uniref:Uncharacterized protein n=1 Tax=Rhizobium phaseoli TaxID=396 RepID=A0A7X6J2H0_9HYPH|nr:MULTISPECIES: hypothetical protein [Rhizobium]MDH6645937.1 hypothetical protein [Rhizobium esperanzae]MDE8761584.1 hypothetical protein [Rhizobium sp. CBK13]NKF08992.1 hypothetical protein [Rhizobium phaseoli]QPK12367.1 hypothetical protein HER27_030625 [Rhizobium phaseoli]RUM22529.1 hypothetical protein EFD56_01145 [Rhizobium phaseoli]
MTFSAMKRVRDEPESALPIDEDGMRPGGSDVIDNSMRTETLLCEWRGGAGREKPNTFHRPEFLTH